MGYGWAGLREPPPGLCLLKNARSLLPSLPLFLLSSPALFLSLYPSQSLSLSSPSPFSMSINPLATKEIGKERKLYSLVLHSTLTCKICTTQWLENSVLRLMWGSLICCSKCHHNSVFKTSPSGMCCINCYKMTPPSPTHQVILSQFCFEVIH